MNFEISFGETLRKLREEKQLPLREVAEALSIDTSMLGKIEKNHRRPTRKMIEKIAEYFKVSDKDLIVAHISDTIAYKVLDEEDLSNEVLQVAEEKVKYLRTKKTTSQ